jgi:hypothetical protein
MVNIILTDQKERFERGASFHFDRKTYRQHVFFTEHQSRKTPNDNWMNYASHSTENDASTVISSFLH